MRKFKRLNSIIMTLVMLATLMFSMNTFAVASADETGFNAMKERAEALINYEWIPSERIYTWNGNEYNGKKYFEAGETVKGVPYTLFSWELGFDSLLSLEQYKAKSTSNYSTEKYCSSVSANRIGPAYGNCCATLVSEVFGGSFMNGLNPKYDGVGAIQDSVYSTTYTNVKADSIQPGDALSCTSGAHIVWVGDVSDDFITIYESTPPICQKTVIKKASNTNGNGYLEYNGNIYNIVTKSNAITRDDLSSTATLSTEIPMPLHAYTKANEKTLVYDSVNGVAKTNKIYGADLCFIDAVFDNGWCHVNFPLDAGGLEQGYVKTSVFFEKNSITKEKAKAGLPVYSRCDLSETIGRTVAGCEVLFVGEDEQAFQIAYAVSTGGFKLGWISKKDLENPAKQPFLAGLCPIKGYPCVSENFEVKKSDYSTRGGEIYTSDYCTINEIYSDGWCKVTFPMDSGGERTAYTTIDKFVYDVNYNVQSCITKEQTDVYTKKELNTRNNWWTGKGDTIYIVGEYGEALQICYPIDEAYGGGYKLGWVPRSSISIETKKAIEKVEVKNIPTKTVYRIGEKLNLDGLVILVKYNDGSTALISDEFETGSFDSSTPGRKTVTVSYEGFSTSFTVTVEESVADKSPQVLIETTTAKSGEHVDVRIEIKNAPKLKSFAITGLTYDTSKLKIESAVCNVKDVVVSQILSNGNAVAALNSNTDINGLIFTYSFTVKDGVENCRIPISFSFAAKEKPENGIEQIVPFSVINGEIVVKNYMVGDLNGDNVVDSDDSVYLMWHTYLPDNYPLKQNADFNDDGTVDSDDSIYLLWHTYLPDDYPLN